MADETITALNLVQKFHSLQEERVHFYKLFDEGHKIYLNSAPNYEFIKFRKLIHDVTQEFKRISTDIITIEKELRFRQPKIADLIAILQTEEKQKLELSAKLQIAKVEAIDNPNVDEKWTHVARLKEEYDHNHVTVTIRFSEAEGIEQIT